MLLFSFQEVFIHTLTRSEGMNKYFLKTKNRKSLGMVLDFLQIYSYLLYLFNNKELYLIYFIQKSKHESTSQYNLSHL